MLVPTLGRKTDKIRFKHCPAVVWAERDFIEFWVKKRYVEVSVDRVVSAGICHDAIHRFC
jgi:hypothetical protein